MQNVVDAPTNRPNFAPPIHEALHFTESSEWVLDAINQSQLNPLLPHSIQIEIHFVTHPGSLEVQGNTTGTLLLSCGSCGKIYTLPIKLILNQTWYSSEWQGPLSLKNSDFSFIESENLTQLEPLSEMLSMRIQEIIQTTPFCGPTCVPHGFPPLQWSPSCHHSHPEELI